MTLLLAGDIGGTKTLLAVYTLEADGGLRLNRQERYRSLEWADFGSMVETFLEAGTERPRHGCLAIAGPVLNGHVALTNLPWRLEEQALAARLGLDRLELVNDFAVQIYGLPHLSSAQQELLVAGQPIESAPIAILGAGTGLGVAVGVPTSSGVQAMATEASHADFAARTSDEWELRQWMLRDLALHRLSIERVVSGTGLGHVFRWCLATSPANAASPHPLSQTAAAWLAGLNDADASSANADLPAAVASAAQAGDPLARQALDLWLGAYGSAAGDLILHTLCFGGLWLGGGTAGKLLAELRSPAFCEPLQAKGRMRGLVERVPVSALVDSGTGLFSAACRARMLHGQN